MTFSDPRWLWLLAGLPVVALLELWAARRARRGLDRLVGTRTGHALLAQQNPRDRNARALLRISALALLALGAAGPQWGREVVRRAVSGSDIVLAVDVSASMDARDVAPNRLDEARREAVAVLERLSGSRVGVVAFAGDAVRLCPLTLDRSAARLSLEGLGSGSVSEPGTDLGRGLRAALRVLPEGRREEQAIVLWTDGEDLEQGARAALDDVVSAGVRVFAVGVGTPAGDIVPVLDDQGRAVDIKRDEQGNAVRSRLDEDLLKGVARRTHGAYFAASRPGGELPRLLAAVGSIARSARGQRLIERPVARFGWFAAAAVGLLLMERVRARRPLRREAGNASRRRPPRAAAPAATAVRGAAALLLVVVAARPAMAQSAWARGDRAFKAGRFAEAESLYAMRAKRGAPPAVEVNRATARALKGDREQGIAGLARLAQPDTPTGRTAGYNQGTLLGEQKRFDEGLTALRRVLERDPKDQDARWNYEVLLQREQEEREKKAPPQPQPQKPQPSSGGDQGTPPSPTQRPPSGQAPSPSPTGGPPPPPSAGGMDRQQAEQLLNALQELARAEQRGKHVRVLRERRGRDW